MDYDPFEIHMQLLALLRRLSASHQSIDNVVAFLVRYRDKCADDLWECVTDECEKVRLPSLLASIISQDQYGYPRKSSGQG